MEKGDSGVGRARRESAGPHDSIGALTSPRSRAPSLVPGCCSLRQASGARLAVENVCFHLLVERCSRSRTFIVTCAPSSCRRVLFLLLADDALRLADE